MNYSPYPIMQASFFKAQMNGKAKIERALPIEELEIYEKSLLEKQKKEINLIKKNNGLILRDFELYKTPTVSGGFHKPLSEVCAQITGMKGPDETSTALFNNMTRRKSLVKD